MGIINRNGSLYMATGIDNSGLYSGFNKAENRVDQFEAHIKRVGDNITRLTGIGFGVAGLKAFGSEIINVRGEMQMLESSFEVLLGGKGVSGFMSEMKQFAVDSPLSLTGVSQAAQTLLGFGITAEKVMASFTICWVGVINPQLLKICSITSAHSSSLLLIKEASLYILRMRHLCEVVFQCFTITVSPTFIGYLFPAYLTTA